MPIEAIVLAVVVGLGAAVAVALPALRRGDRHTAAVRVAQALLTGAVMAVLAVTLGQGGNMGQSTAVNLVPGSGIRTALNNTNQELGALNLVGNVVMFASVGLLLPVAIGLRWLSTVAVAAVLSILIEVQQLIIGRAFDVDDILLNTGGAAMGAVVGVALASRLQRREGREGRAASA